MNTDRGKTTHTLFICQIGMWRVIQIGDSYEPQKVDSCGKIVKRLRRSKTAPNAVQRAGFAHKNNE